MTNAPALFVCLKGKSRGQPMSPAGLRSLFRHHRMRSRIPHAHPHRLRRTFGSDMVRAGMSLPALQQLLGHSQIQTTIRYVELAPQWFVQDVEGGNSTVGTISNTGLYTAPSSVPKEKGFAVSARIGTLSNGSFAITGITVSP